MTRFLIVEDHPLFREALESAVCVANPDAEILQATSIDEALTILGSTHAIDLILLDLNLPQKGGLEILAEIKADDLLKLIPVVILTSSQAEEDIVNSYNLFANAYVTKPVSLEQFVAAIKSIEDFWIEIVRLPPNQEA